MNMLLSNKHTNKDMQLDFNLYGSSNFMFDIIEQNVSSDELIQRETYWMNYYGGINSSSIYNMQDLYNLNKAVKIKIGMSNTGKYKTTQYKRMCRDLKNKFYNTQQGKQTIQRIKYSLYTYYNTQQGKQFKQKLSDYGKQHYRGSKNPMYGKKHSLKSKQLMSQVKKSHHNIPWNKGKTGLYKATDVTREKQRIASTKYTSDFINELRQSYDKLGSYSKVAEVYNMNPLCVSRLIRFGTTKYPPKIDKV